MKNFKCQMEFFEWGKKKELSWIRITSPTGNDILINIRLKRSLPLDRKDYSFLRALANGKEWPSKNTKEYSKETLQRFLEISKK